MTAITDTLLPAGTIPRKEVYDFILAAEAGHLFNVEVLRTFIDEIVDTGMVAHLPAWGPAIQQLRGHIEGYVRPPPRPN